jgi:hypothetical protein
LNQALTGYVKVPRRSSPLLMHNFTETFNVISETTFLNSSGGLLEHDVKIGGKTWYMI